MNSDFDIQLPPPLVSLIPHFCDKCGHRHSRSDLEIISRDQNGVAFRLDCHNCGNSYMMQFSNPVDGVAAGRKIMLKNDMNSSEMKKFTEMGVMSKDELLDALNALGRGELVN